MRNAHIIPALSPEARLRREIRHHLVELGFHRGGTGELIPPGDEKAAIRELHRCQRSDKILKSTKLIDQNLSMFAGVFAGGSDISPSSMSLAIERVDAGTKNSKLFRLATLLWSVPVSSGFGRRIKYLVWDTSNGKLAGLLAIGDPVFNLSVRDNAIGWSSRDRTERLVNVLDAFVVGSIPPYNMLLTGKIVACLLRTREIYDDFLYKYGNARGIISERHKAPRLLAITTSSSLGRSSIYNRLKLEGLQYFRPIGYTKGWGHFHIPSSLFEQIRSLLRLHNHPYARENRYGSGPNWHFRMLREGLRLLDLDPTLLRHGVKREVFLCELAQNAISLLRGDAGAPNIDRLETVATVSSAGVDRWVIPRAARCPQYESWNASDTLTLIRRLPRQYAPEVNSEQLAAI